MGNTFIMKNLKWMCLMHRVIYLKETRVRTTHAARKMLLCRLEAAKRHLNPGKIFAHCPEFATLRSVCVFSPWPWLVINIIDSSLCVCFVLGLGLGWLLCVCVFVLALASLVIVCVVCYCMCLPQW